MRSQSATSVHTSPRPLPAPGLMRRGISAIGHMCAATLLIGMKVVCSYHLVSLRRHKDRVLRFEPVSDRLLLFPIDGKCICLGRSKDRL